MNEHNLAKQSDKDKHNSDDLTQVILIMGADRHIENHISKNCRVINDDVSKFLSRALNAQKEMT